MKLSISGLAIASALLWGGGLLFVGVLNLREPSYGAAFLQMMSSVYPGFKASPTTGNVIVGTLYAAGDGAICGFLFAWLSNVVALFVAAWIVSGVDYGDDFWVLFIAALVFTVVNWFVRPIVILLALPAVVLTLGLALVLINTFMLYLTDWIVPSFETGSFWSTLLAAIIVSLVNLVIGLLLKPDQPEPRTA